ncbi:MAG: phosphoribosylanthranilate isomerase [Phycisphaerales bacterium]|jgi:phosphoribosylanthranilate isomerase|nr:phosphoribosylanthranilate isomerase [Phycisphaerales bacterium]
MNQFPSQTSGVDIKICGLREEEHVDIAVGAGANAIGLVFVESSPRFIERHVANQLLLQVPNDVVSVAVLQNHTSLEDFYDWNGMLQLCGTEDEETIINIPIPVIRAFKWNRQELLRWDACPNVHALLVDGSTGGLGERFDHSEIAELIPTLSKPVIIAGGLSPANIEEVIKYSKPSGVDVSSGVESSRGVKDPYLICDFINRVLNTN